MTSRGSKGMGLSDSENKRNIKEIFRNILDLSKYHISTGNGK